MSIIYDALKKSQRARANHQQRRITVARLPGNRRTQLIAILVLLSLLFAVVTLIKITLTPAKPALAQHTQAVKLPPPKPAAMAVAAPRLLLEGVFLSDKEKLAMINHRAYHEGDLLNDMKIINIAFDQVTLKNKSRYITLRSDISQFD